MRSRQWAPARTVFIGDGQAISTVQRGTMGVIVYFVVATPLGGCYSPQVDGKTVDLNKQGKPEGGTS